jgi:hypothetical protein
VNDLQKRAFILGYLNKEAIGMGAHQMANPTSPSTSATSYTPSNTKKKPGWQDQLGTKLGDLWAAEDHMKGAQMDFERKGRQKEKEIRSELASKEKGIRAELTSGVEKAKKQMKQGLIATAAVPTLATLGTGFLQNMAANKRHQQLMQMMKRMRGGARTPGQAAFRLQHGQNRTRNYYGGS